MAPQNKPVQKEQWQICKVVLAFFQGFAYHNPGPFLETRAKTKSNILALLLRRPPNHGVCTCFRKSGSEWLKVAGSGSGCSTVP